MSRNSLEYRIRPQRGVLSGWDEIWRFRELVWMMAWREIRVKYKQSFFGVLWALVQPASMALVFFMIFQHNPPSEHQTMPYYLYVFSGMILWTFFSSSLQNAVQQMLGYAPIVKKVYFPRLYIPFSSIIIAGFDFIWGLMMLLVLLCIRFGGSVLFNVHYPCMFIGIGMTILSGIFLSIWMSALVVKYRDFRYVVTFLLQMLFFITPVFYASDFSLWKGTWKDDFFYWHPLAAAMDLFRSSLLGFCSVGFRHLILFVLLILSGGLSVLYFRRTEEYMSDVI